MIELPESAGTLLQEHFDHIFDKIKLSGEDISPQVFLVNCSGAAAFVMPTASKQHIFYCYHAFVSFSSEEVEANVHAHEITHFFQDGMNSDILKEYDAEVRGILKRIVRLGERDPETGDPQDSPYSIEALIKSLRSNTRHSKDHMANYRMASVLEVVYGVERSKRGFAEQATARQNIEPIVTAVQALPSLPPLLHIAEDSSTDKQVDTIKASLENRDERIDLQLKNVIELTDQTLSQEGEIDMAEMYYLLALWDNALTAIRQDHGRASQIDNYYQTHNRYRVDTWNRIRPILEANPLNPTQMNFLEEIGNQFRNMKYEKFLEIRREAYDRVVEGFKTENPEKYRKLVDSETPAYSLVGLHIFLDEAGALSRALNASSAFLTCLKQFAAVQTREGLPSFLNSCGETLLASPPIRWTRYDLIMQYLVSEEFVQAIYSSEIIQEKQVILLNVIPQLEATGTSEYARDILVALETHGHEGNPGDYKTAVNQLLLASKNPAAWSPLLDYLGKRELLPNTRILEATDRLFATSWEGVEFKKRGASYHFLAKETRAFLLPHLPMDDPKIRIQFAPLDPATLQPLVAQLTEGKEYVYLFERFAEFFVTNYGLEARVAILQMYRQTIETWSDELEQRSRAVSDPRQTIDFITRRAEEIYQAKLREEQAENSSDGTVEDTGRQGDTSEAQNGGLYRYANQFRHIDTEISTFSEASVILLKLVGQGDTSESIALSLANLYRTEMFFLDGRRHDFFAHSLADQTGLNRELIEEIGKHNWQEDTGSLSDYPEEERPRLLWDTGLLLEDFLGDEEIHLKPLRQLDASLLKVLRAYLHSYSLDDLYLYINDNEMYPEFHRLKQVISDLIERDRFFFLSSWLQAQKSDYRHARAPQNPSDEFDMVSILDVIIDWNVEIAKLSVQEFSAVLIIASENRGFAERVPNLFSALADRALQAYKNQKFDLDQLMAAQNLLVKFLGSSSSPAIESLVKFVIKEVDFADERRVDQLARAIQPKVFANSQQFIEIVTNVLFAKFELTQAIGQSYSQEEIIALSGDLNDFLSRQFTSLDPKLRVDLLEHLAEKLNVSPQHREVFENIENHQVYEAAGTVTEFAHVWSQVFEKLDIQDQYELLQFLRGGTASSLSDRLRAEARFALRGQGIFVNPNLQQAVAPVTIAAL
ncbi:MAG: hypothetical protein AAF202_01655, partial [Pseudomonadota bacterium]